MSDLKTVVLTIKPKHLRRIVSGEKRVELRKSVPECGAPFRVVCCASGTGGDVVGEFICDRVTRHTKATPLLAEMACIKMDMLDRYMGVAQAVYAWRVTGYIDYAAQDRVKHVTDYGMRRAPRSWCYARGGKSA